MNVIHVRTRNVFDQFLADMRRTYKRVFDTETRGLNTYQGDVLISISIYLPEIDRIYNLPFRYGSGDVQVHYTKENQEGMTFEQMNWQGRTKKEMYLRYWFNKFAAHMESQDDENGDYLNYFENLPESWLEEVKAVWGRGEWIGHNTRFDAHVLYVDGFPDMEKVYDTMIALHIVNEDWKGISVEAPYKYTKKDAEAGRVPESSVGQWAVDGAGNLLKKEQKGARGLKWVTAFLGFNGATEGEQGLNTARIEFEETITDFIMANVYDPMNNSLITKTQRKLLDAVAYGAQPTQEYWDALDAIREKVRSKIELDDKANMWMLPSGKVAYYAGMDVHLTWQLLQWCLPIIHDWHNDELWETQSRIHHFVAWEMERNGFRLDSKQAQAEIDKLQPRIAQIEEILAMEAVNWIELEDDMTFKVSSPKQLLPFLNSGVLATPCTHVFPDWWPEENKLELKVYPNIRLNERELEEQYDPLEGTNKAELHRVEDHPVVRLVKEHRRMSKSVSTYLEKWMRAKDAKDIVRFAINDDGTVAGRASSSGAAGNGQNIPDRGGYTIKRAIVPYNDQWKLFAFDYGQLELRLGSWIAEGLLGFDPDMTMTKLFLSGEDMHSYVRDMIGIRSILFGDMTDKQIVIKLGYSLESDKANTPEKWADIVSEFCRYVAKTMNFGLLYSGGAPMLSKLLRLDQDVSKTLVYKWRNMFPAFPRAQSYFTKLALTRRSMPNGTFPNSVMYVTQPISGRHRKLHKYATDAVYAGGVDANGKTEWLHFNPMEAAARKVWNNTDQGLGGFICMDSALNIGDELGREYIRLFANIHDALEGFLHVDHLHLMPKIGEIMTRWPTIIPGLTVDAQGSIDGTWQGMTKIKDMNLWIASKGEYGYGQKLDDDKRSKTA